MTPDRQFCDPRLAELYDLGNAGSEDRDFYLSLADAPQLDILDLGCGTGLLAMGYAARGHSVVGVDPATAMLDVARRQDVEQRVNWVQQTAEGFESESRFDLVIMTGHAFQVLLTDDQVEAVLRNMASLLKLEGRVVFESRNPALNWDAIWAREYTMETSGGPVRAVRRLTDAAQAPDFISFAWDYHFPDDIVTSDSTLRFLPREIIISAAQKAGLTLEALYGDWDARAFNAEHSREMIFKFRLKDAQ